MFVLDDIHNTLNRLAGLAVEFLQPAIANRAAANRGIKHIGQADIACKIRAAIQLCRHIKARNILARKPVYGRRIKWDGIGRIKPRRFCHQIGKGNLLFAPCHKASRRVTIFPFGVPTGRCCLTKLDPRSRSGLAACRFKHTKRRRARRHHEAVTHGQLIAHIIAKLAKGTCHKCPAPFACHQSVGK
jgi:hypothetical protein